ncbi:MAG TPA: two pore domain potassium channel family protein, partial [Lysobacter sp.]
MADNRIGMLRWRAQARRHPSAFLLAAQVVSLILYPLFDEMRGGRVLFGALGVAVLMLAVWVVGRSPGKVWVAWLLAAPALALSVASVVLGNDTLLVLSSALEALLYLYAAASLIAYML